MNAEDVKVGMKVVPYTKTAGLYDLKECPYYKRATDNGQSYLYVVRKHPQESEGVFYLSDTMEFPNRCSCYHADDFEPYQEDIATLLAIKNKELMELQEALEEKKKEIEEFKKNHPCEHSRIKVNYFYGSSVEIMFQCVDCNKLINKFDNTKTFTIVPNEYLQYPPTETGLWKRN